MITKIKHFFILFALSLMPLNMIHHAEEAGFLFMPQSIMRCDIITYLSEKMSWIIACQESEQKDMITNFDDKKSNTYKKNEHSPTPFLIETSARTIHWISHFRWNLQRLLVNIIQKDFVEDELLPFQIYSNDIYIPELAYYIYTLEEITV